MAPTIWPFPMSMIETQKSSARAAPQGKTPPHGFSIRSVARGRTSGIGPARAMTSSRPVRQMGSSALVPRTASAYGARSVAGSRGGGRRVVSHSPVARRGGPRLSLGFGFKPDNSEQIRHARKLLFLDVDGVLNTEYCRPRDAIHSKLLKRLGEVVHYSGTKIILSSTWRLHPQYRMKLLSRLESVGVDRLAVLDDTPQLPLKMGRWPPAESNRAEEIAEWIRTANVRPDLIWVAVDDLDVMNSPHGPLFDGHFVRTSRESGLSAECQAQLFRILGPR